MGSRGELTQQGRRGRPPMGEWMESKAVWLSPPFWWESGEKGPSSSSSSSLAAAGNKVGKEEEREGGKAASAEAEAASLHWKRHRLRVEVPYNVLIV